MKRKLAQIISALLILSMLSTCVYATDNTTPSDAVNSDSGSSEQPITITLEKPEITSLTAGQKDVTVTFTAVDDATKYIVYYNAGGSDLQKETTSTTTTVSNLTEETTYNFRVIAVCETEDKTVESEPSDIVSVATGLITLGTPTLTLSAYNKGAILKWNSIYGATGYEIWRYYNKKWSKIKTVGASTLQYKNTGLKLNKKYYYKVRAVRNSRVSNFSSNKSITAKTYLTSSTIKIGYSKGRLWKAAKKYKEGSNKVTIGKSKIKSGTKVTILKRKQIRGNSMAYVKLPNGKKYWIKAFNISFSAPYTTKDYTTEVKENFVNKQGYSSKTKYLLFICHYTQKVYLFKGKKGNWDLQKTYKCATGKASTRTPLGVYKITRKAKRTPAGSKYVTYFKSWNAFHARPAGSKTMSRPASNGCIRMYTNDAIYIHKKIPKGTTVVSY